MARSIKGCILVPINLSTPSLLSLFLSSLLNLHGIREYQSTCSSNKTINFMHALLCYWVTSTWATPFINPKDTPRLVWPWLLLLIQDSIFLSMSYVCMYAMDQVYCVRTTGTAEYTPEATKIAPQYRSPRCSPTSKNTYPMIVIIKHKRAGKPRCWTWSEYHATAFLKNVMSLTYIYHKPKEFTHTKRQQHATM